MTRRDHDEGISARAEAISGVPGLVYVKRLVVEGRRAYGIFGADGTEIAAFARRDVAFAVARQQDWEPVSAH